MDHKFKGYWRCYLASDDGLERTGTMDLSNMTPDGDLAEGWYDPDDPAGERQRMRGTARGAGSFYILSLEVLDNDNDEYFDRYQGALVYQTPSEGMMVVAGSLHYGVDVKRSKLVEQNDPPWVITKP